MAILLKDDHYNGLRLYYFIRSPTLIYQLFRTESAEQGEFLLAACLTSVDG